MLYLLAGVPDMRAEMGRTELVPASVELLLEEMVMVEMEEMGTVELLLDEMGMAELVPASVELLPSEVTVEETGRAGASAKA